MTTKFNLKLWRKKKKKPYQSRRVLQLIVLSKKIGFMALNYDGNRVAVGDEYG